MEAQYEPEKIEGPWQKVWERRGTFHADPDSPGEKFYMLEMFPYPSGRIHMGHVRNYAIGDVATRYWKKRGYNVLHPMGWDAFGLPAENAAIERGIHPAGWTYDNIREMRSQLKTLGMGYDWRREIATCHPEYYRWEQLIFIRALEKGLAYRKRALVNWSEKMQTVLANEQVIDGCDYRYGLPVEQKELTQWFFKTTHYAEELLAGLETLEGQWPERVLLEQRARIGKSHGAEVVFQHAEPIDGESEFSVFTTRPDTLWGVTFMSLAAEHPLAHKLAAGTEQEGAVRAFVSKVLAEDKHRRGAEDYEKEGVFTGRHCINPVNGERVPIYVANFVLMDYGTGAVMAVPAHDQRDFEFAKKYGIPVKIVIQPKDGAPLDAETMTEAYVDDGLQVGSAQFDGLENRAAIEKIADYLAAEGWGGKTINYRLRDWCVSRQRYWGAPIPVVYCEKCNVVPVPEDQLPVRLPEEVVFQAEGGSPLARHEDFVHTACPQCGGPAKRETDTFDTFVESSWYFLRYTSPRCDSAPLEAKEVERWMPVDQYIGGIEHAVGHLVYARFYHRLMQDLGFVSKTIPAEPFARLLTQGMVVNETRFTLDEKGQPVWHEVDEVDEHGISKLNGQKVEIGRVEKMSKSKRNGVDPRGIIDQFGVDAARLFTLFAAPPENDVVWKQEGVEGVHRFLIRVWKLIRERLEAIRTIAPYAGDGSDLTAASADLRRMTHKTIAQVTGDIEKRMRFNTAIARCMELANAIGRPTGPETPAGQSIQRDAIIALIHLLTPFAPHFAEEVWRHIGGEGLAAEAAWPTWDRDVAADEVVTIAVQVMGKLRATLAAPVDVTQEELERLALANENVQRHIEGKTVRKIIVVPGKLVNIVAG